MQTAALQTAIDAGQLRGSDLSFAMDLVASERRYGRLTPRQAPWVTRLLAAATTAPRPAQNLGDVTALAELFNRPRLQFPKVRLQTADGSPVVFHKAGQRSKFPGSISITDGQPYGVGRWYGRVLATGEWQKPASGVPAGVVEVVIALATSPAETAAAHGHLTGRCCFCSRKLDDERSTQVGYGPVCAANFGLAWG